MTQDWEQQWNLPQTVHDLDVAFPARGMELAPTWEQARQALAELPDDWRAECETFATALFSGIPKIQSVGLYADVDGEVAFRHLGVVAGCYAFKHEHKLDALAYLASQWMGEFTYESVAMTPRPAAKRTGER